MARLPYVTREQLPEPERDIFDNLLAQRGAVGNVFRMAAHSPLLLRRMLYFSDGLRNRTRLDPRLRELAIMTVGRLTECDYEYVHHQALAKRIGVHPEQVERLAAWETDPAFNEQERAVIRYATEMTLNVRIADATFDALRAFLDNEQIIELTMNTAFYNMVVRFLMATQVELEPDARRQP
ncbi:MAG TPA: carboxymuconolactone decarboxylase family protein [Methylomirabilota bacterium]|nr:carboxymuconolactone decarboxylase family protein [Methylomirabilota bacterium]